MADRAYARSPILEVCAPAVRSPLRKILQPRNERLQPNILLSETLSKIRHQNDVKMVSRKILWFCRQIDEILVHFAKFSSAYLHMLRSHPKKAEPNRRKPGYMISILKAFYRAERR